MCNITEQQLTDKIKELVAKFPDRIYESIGTNCSYVDSNDSPGKGCLFGEALKELGVSIEKLKAFDQENDGSGLSIDRVLEKYFNIYTRKFDSVQTEQDHGVMWKDCIYSL
jgi:hypothetical protein